jgi:hypothetical protein
MGHGPEEGGDEENREQKQPNSDFLQETQWSFQES